MDEQLTLEQISSFSDKFNKNIENKIVMDSIKKSGLNKFCINKDIIKENEPTFNIELSETKRMNQKYSARCWNYSGLNFIKRDIAKNLNINIDKFELSPTFVAFYDRLEKANSLYNKIIYDNVDLKIINEEDYFLKADQEEGRFEFFRAIVNKYGIVPYKFMKDTKDSLNSYDLKLLLNEKVKKDCLELMNYKKHGKDCISLKNKFLYEVYDMLCKVIGQPPRKFNYSYTNLNNEKIMLKNITPLEFKEKFLNINLNDYVGVSSIENYDRKLYNKYRRKLFESVYENSYIEYINLPLERLKELIVKQLKDGEPVVFDSEIEKFRDKTSGVLDTRLYDYNKYFPFNELNRKESFNFRDIFARHVMNFTGVQLEDNRYIRWKVEDSYGDKCKYNGYYIMNDNWFDKYVIRVIVNKKYLDSKEIDVLNSKAIMVDNYDGI